jgi:hypothetical protein
MEKPFESAEFLIRRANRHVHEFNAIAAEFLASDAYSVRSEFNRATGLVEVKLKFVRMFPEDLRGCASDAIKNIRDSLDQAMSAASFVITGKRSRYTNFPFGISADDLEESLSRRKASQCKGIPEELFAAIRHIRPYPYSGDDSRLKLLQKVSGPHKHSVALTLGSAAPFPFSEVGMIDKDGNVAVTINFPEWDRSKDEIVVATHNGDGKLDLSHAFHISFDHCELRNIPASQVLDAWGKRADWAIQVLKKFSAQVVAERK